MTKTIYEQHDDAFSNVSAHVIMQGGERIATIAFKFPKDGAGRLWCYFHTIGLPMVRDYAGGYGYDKASAAAWGAILKIRDVKLEAWQTTDRAEEFALIEKILKDWKDGYDWKDNFEE